MTTTSSEQRFTELYERHYTDVDAYVRRRIHSDQVRDVVSEVFLVVWRRLDDVPDGAVLPWLYGVARNTLGNTYRVDQRRLRLVELMATQPPGDVDDHADSVVGLIDLASAFDRLGPSDQEVLRLTLWEELPAREAARVLGCGAAAFRVRLHRARKRLRRQLAEMLSGEVVPSTAAPGRRVHQTNWGATDA
ncbi:RNA polymerase sigma factor [Streptomyces sp. JNUCC 64]